ncbi:polyprotein of EF-Ts, chloroplastic [Brassica napus]|nr:polyprotein of EF-Ts, chloroplastic [Brassica napus]
MATVTPSSISKPWLVPGAAFTVKKNDCSIKCCFSRKAGKHIPPSTQRLVLPLSTSLKLFPTHGRHFVLHPHRTRATTETDLVAAAVEGQDSPPVPETDANDKSDDSAPPAAPTSRGTARPGRKSEMPAVKNEELVAGATFTGKVRAIQPFGAFIDFGAFTDGLVHVSQLSDTFVKDVASVVSIGQEVKVRLVEADIEAKRISLTMRSNDDPPKRQSGGGDNKPRPGGKRGGQKKEDGFSSKYVKGQMLDGTVKNLTRSGAFITIGEGEEGFLPTNEEADDGIGSMMMGGGSSLQAEQEVKVRVLRIARGRVTLTMKEEDDGKFDETLSQGVVHTATNPFVLAFRKNVEIAAFLDKREEEAEKPVEPVKESEEAITSEKVDESLSLSPEEVLSETPKVEEEEVIETKAEEETEEQTETLAAAAEVEEVEKVEETPDVPPVPETKSEEEVSENSIPQSSATDEVSSPEAVVSEDVEKKEEVVAEVPVAETVPDEVPSSEAVATEDVEKKEEVVAGVPVAEAIPDEVSSPEAVASEDVEKVAEVPVAEAETPAAVVTEASTEESGIKAGISPALVKQLREETGAGMMDCKNALLESEGDMVKAQEYLRKKGLASADKKASRATAEGRIGSYIHDSRIGVLLEVNCETDFVSRGDIFKELVDDLAMQVAACPQVEYLVPEDVSEEIVMKEKEIEMQKEDLLSKPEQIREKIVEGRIKKRVDALALLEQPYIKDDKVIVKDLVKQRIATIGENIKVKRFIRYTLGEGLEKKSQDFAAEVAAQTAAKPKAEPEKEQPKAEELPKEAVPSPPTAVVSAGLVKQLREETGAGMMDCKKALAETGGDLEKAQEYLRKKGLSTADKKSSRLAAEGRIGSYIHDARIGVLIEVNCETDFVGRSEKFKELVDDLAMQAVANPQVQYVSIEDIPEEIKQKEKEIEMQREDLESKPENIKEKIVEGRISKRLGEMALLEQPFIKDDSVLVKDLVKQTVATLGENIKVRRFVKFTLGEDN